MWRGKLTTAHNGINIKQFYVFNECSSPLINKAERRNEGFKYLILILLPIPFPSVIILFGLNKRLRTVVGFLIKNANTKVFTLLPPFLSATLCLWDYGLSPLRLKAFRSFQIRNKSGMKYLLTRQSKAHIFIHRFRKEQMLKRGTNDSQRRTIKKPFVWILHLYILRLSRQFWDLWISLKYFSVYNLWNIIVIIKNR